MARSWQLYLGGWALIVAMLVLAVGGANDFPIFRQITAAPDDFAFAATAAWAVYTAPWLLYSVVQRFRRKPPGE